MNLSERADMRNGLTLTARWILGVVLGSSLSAHPAGVLFVTAPQSPAEEIRAVQLAADFYGLHLNTIQAGTGASAQEIRKAAKDRSTTAVILSSAALARVNGPDFLGKDPDLNAPLLIIGVTSRTNKSALGAWTGDAVLGATTKDLSGGTSYYFERVPAISGPLSEASFPLQHAEATYLNLNAQKKVEWITSLHGDTAKPVLVLVQFERHRLFVAGSVRVKNSPNRILKDTEPVDSFPSFAPVFLFLKNAAGPSAWHMVHHYANLTIDDPWLRKTYGNLDYQALLAEAIKHNFHVTIAFIPWNYQRSDPGVVSLFRNHPDRFSIAIHGDNHDHSEFTESKPIAVQRQLIADAWTRMEKFEKLTGIPFDPVMVFPHHIPMEATLEALKADNFLATINASNVPMDQSTPSDLAFYLRPVTLKFADLPSIQRDSMSGESAARTALNSFLDNPHFFYGHQDSLASGDDAFDAVADEVNKQDPETRWRSLGEIVRHLYLVRSTGSAGNHFDVLAFSPTIQLESPAQAAVFDVQKEENGRPAIHSVTVDGRPYPYQFQDGYVRLRVPVAASETRDIAIHYDGATAVSAQIEKFSLRIYGLRMSSDFRDLVLSQVGLGRSLTRLYYDHEIAPRDLVLLTGAVLLVLAGAVYSLRSALRRRRDGKVGSTIV